MFIWNDPKRLSSCYKLNSMWHHLTTPTPMQILKKCKWSYPGFGDQKLTLTLTKDSGTAKIQISNFLNNGNLALKKFKLQSSLPVDSTPLLEMQYDTNEGYESWKSNWNRDPRKHKNIPEVYAPLAWGKKGENTILHTENVNSNSECRWRWDEQFNACGEGGRKKKRKRKQGGCGETINSGKTRYNSILSI